MHRTFRINLPRELPEARIHVGGPGKTDGSASNGPNSKQGDMVWARLKLPGRGMNG